MGVLDRLKNLFATSPSNARLDVSQRFQLQQQSVSGTMSKFRVAREITTGRIVGLKFLDAEKSAVFKARFKGLKKPPEGAIASKIKHPNVVQTLEYGVTTTGQEYILMEYIDGPGLGALIKARDPRMIARRLEFLREMAEAIQAVHDAGFIHRDICPRNFICNAAIDEIKLIDFGLSVPDLPEFRQPGNRTGTPQYMAPEIVRRRPTDRRVDVFAFGVTAYRMLTFEHPWGSTNTTGLGALAHDSRDATSIFELRPKLNERLGRAIERCLKVKPDDRYSAMKQFSAAINDIATEE
jgi:serine/threonine-protein kinase